MSIVQVTELNLVDRFIDDQGRLTQEAQYFLIDLWRRTGGYTDNVDTAQAQFRHVAISASSTVTLAAVTDAIGEPVAGRFFFLEFTGAGSVDIILPDISGSYFVWNNSGGPLTFKTGADAVGKVVAAGRFDLLAVEDIDFSVRNLQHVSGSPRLLARYSAGAGIVQEATLNATLEFDSGALRRAALTGEVTSAAGSNATVVNPGGTVTVAAGDLVLIQDITDSNSLQRVTAQSIADLGGGGLTQEQVEDFVGGMVTGNVETFISVTYDDPGGKLDFVVPVKDEDDMVSNSATDLATQQSIKAYVDATAGGAPVVSVHGRTGSVVAVAGDYTAVQTNMAATARILGRITAGAGVTEELTGTQATTLIDAVVGDSGSGGTKGLAPAPGAGDAAAGKFLKADASWAVPPGGSGGGNTLLDETTADGSANTITVTSVFDTTYDRYLVELLDLKLASDGELKFRFTQSGTPLSGASDYDWAIDELTSGTGGVDSDADDNQIDLTDPGADADGDASTSFIEGDIRVYRPGDTNNHKRITFDITHIGAGGGSIFDIRGAGRLKANTTACDGFQLIGRNTTDAGDVNIAGTVRVWGLPKA
jgi:hypothetical protein